MFGFLSDRLSGVISKFSGQGKISEKDLDQRLRELRLGLLEADVHFQVARDFIIAVREKAIGQQVLDSLTPSQMIIKIFHDELTEVMGGRGCFIGFGCQTARAHYVCTASWPVMTSAI